MTTITSYKRYEGESDLELIYRVTSDKEQIGSWQDVADILNELLGTRYSESKFRKQKQSFDKMLEANRSKFVNTSAQLEEIQLQKRELERKKIQFRDERNAWQKQNYIDARIENKLDLLEKELVQLGKVNFCSHDYVNVESDNDMLVVLSDFHIGQCFNSVWGEYNPDIAKERISKLLSEVIAIQKIHNSEKCFVGLCGDMISGSIHKSIQVTNSQNVIEQIKLATELISSFCYELSKYFSNVFVYSVVGNHTRIEKKDDAIHDERLDDIITWGAALSLRHISNIKFMKTNSDIGIADITIRGQFYTMVHGDYDPFTKGGILNLCSMLGYFPYSIIMGHMHTCALDEANGIKMIRGGSLAGSGDSYTVEKRLSGKPSQMVCICNKKGIVCCYPIELV